MTTPPLGKRNAYHRHELGFSESRLEDGDILLNGATAKLTPTPAITWPSRVSGAPPPMAQYRACDMSGKSGCPGCTIGKMSAVRIPTRADV
jgi:hypothetical protein